MSVMFVIRHSIDAAILQHINAHIVLNSLIHVVRVIRHSVHAGIL